MEVTFSQGEDGYTYVLYAEGKRPLKIAVYVLGDVEYEVLFRRMIEFIQRESNAPEHLAKMTGPKFMAFVERMATLICKEYSPTKNLGITKPEIRGAVLFVLQAGLKAGRWPDEFEMTSRTFVQFGGGS